MQIARLFEIVYLLLDKKSTTAKELAEHFEVSTRTILRDIEALTTAGIPIYTSRGKGGGISILEHFVLNKTLISEEEQNQILFGLKSMAAVNTIDTADTLTRLQLLFKKSRTDWIEIDFSNWGSPASEKEKFARIKQAVISRKILEFDYLNSYGQRTHRQVEPLRVVFKGHSWYLQAFCRQKQDYRIYKISRIRNLKMCDISFDRNLPDNLGFDVDRLNPEHTVTLKLRFAPEIAFRVYDMYDDSGIESHEDGSITATATYPYDDWVISHILSFGSAVEVIEPDDLRQEVADRARRIAEKYQNHPPVV